MKTPVVCIQLRADCFLHVGEAGLCACEGQSNTNVYHHTSATLNAWFAGNPTFKEISTTHKVRIALCDTPNKYDAQGNTVGCAERKPVHTFMEINID